MSKASISNEHGTYHLELLADGKVEVLGFDPAPAGTRWRGLGDVVASAPAAVGVTPCGGCKRRQEALNRLVPFGGSNEKPPSADQLPAVADGSEKNEDSTLT